VAEVHENDGTPIVLEVFAQFAQFASPALKNISRGSANASPFRKD